MRFLNKFISNWDIRFCFKQKKYNINAYLYRNNVTFYNFSNIIKFLKL